MSDPTVIQTKVFAAIMELLGEKSLSIADKTRLIGDGGGLGSMKLDQSQARLPSSMPLMLKMMRKLNRYFKFDKNTINLLLNRLKNDTNL